MCRACNNISFLKPTFNEKKVEKILENLIVKIRKNCYGENIGTSWQDRDQRVVRTKPHERDLCEACTKGVCNKERDA